MIYYRTDTYVVKKRAVDKGDGIMVALQVPPDVAKMLAVKGGQEPSDLHLTLAYLGKASEFTPKQMNTLHEIVADIARATPPVDVTLTGTGVFPETDDGPCLHITVDESAALKALHETVDEAVSAYGMPPTGKGADNWTPHITLAYGESAPAPESPAVRGFRADWLRVTFGGTEALMRLQGVAKDHITTSTVPGMAADPTDSTGKQPTEKDGAGGGAAGGGTAGVGAMTTGDLASGG